MNITSTAGNRIRTLRADAEGVGDTCTQVNLALELGTLGLRHWARLAARLAREAVQAAREGEFVAVGDYRPYNHLTGEVYPQKSEADRAARADPFLPRFTAAAEALRQIASGEGTAAEACAAIAYAYAGLESVMSGGGGCGVFEDARRYLARPAHHALHALVPKNMDAWPAWPATVAKLIPELDGALFECRRLTADKSPPTPLLNARWAEGEGWRRWTAVRYRGLVVVVERGAGYGTPRYCRVASRNGSTLPVRHWTTVLEAPQTNATLDEEETAAVLADFA